jgi:hypothetical protein
MVGMVGNGGGWWDFVVTMTIQTPTGETKVSGGTFRLTSKLPFLLSRQLLSTHALRSSGLKAKQQKTEESHNSPAFCR